MRQALETLDVRTDRRGMVEITGEVADWVRRQGIGRGLLTVWIRHTSASLVVQENADPDVVRDLEAFLGDLVPDDPSRYRHVAEGPDDMPAHIRGALTQSQLSIPVEDGRPQLGTWQGIFLWEHRTRPHNRRVTLHLLGE